MTVPKKRVAVLISGRGSNMRVLAHAAGREDYPAEIALVFSNDPNAAGLAWAETSGIATLAIRHRGFPTREAFDRTLDHELQARQIDIVCLAGFMRLLSPWFVDRWSGRMINIHPSLLPSFRGLDTHARALEAGVTIHGCTVHYVVPEVDAGPIIAQAAVPVMPNDTAEDLAARVLRAEHIIYEMALSLVASGKTTLENGKVSGGIFAAFPNDKADGA